MSKESIQKILDESNNCNCNVVFHTYNDFFCYNNNFDMAFTGLKTFNITVPDVKPLKDDVYMLNLFLEDKDVKPFMDHTPEFKFIRLRGLGYDVVQKDINKATGIANLIKKIGIKQEETIAIGDGLNDIEMIEYAGLGISMGNGVKELKEKANYITTDVNDNGIYNAFKHFELIK
jgi:Cof subfamily protein (haloacid dehalogenase superfamily)